MSSGNLVPPKKDKCSPKKVEVEQLEGTEELIEKEIGGPKGPEPTRYGDWEVKGRCSDF